MAPEAQKYTASENGCDGNKAAGIGDAIGFPECRGRINVAEE